MRSLARISTSLVAKAMGSVDAGACIAIRDCCCNKAHTRGYDCYGLCINKPDCIVHSLVCQTV